MVIAFLVLAVSVIRFLNKGIHDQKIEPALVKLHQDVTDTVDFFCEQHEKLAADPWFHEQRTEGGDAAPFLGVWLAWEPQTETPKESPLVLPKQFSLPAKDWVSTSVDVSSLDFGWMRQLHAYDRWDLLNSPSRASTGPLNWNEFPMPTFQVLRDWSKLRLLQGLRSGQPLEAAKDVRHLAWLLYRTETLLGAMHAAALLDLEREAHDSMREPPPEWQPMSSEQIARMKALLFGSSVLGGVTAPLEVAKKARHCGRPAVTLCIGLVEAAAVAKLAKPGAEDDEEFREGYAAFKAELAASPCATSTAQSIWERGLTMDDAKLEKDPRLSGQAFMRALSDENKAGFLLMFSSIESLKPLLSYRKSLETGR